MKSLLIILSLMTTSAAFGTDAPKPGDKPIVEPGQVLVSMQEILAEPKLKELSQYFTNGDISAKIPCDLEDGYANKDSDLTSGLLIGLKIKGNLVVEKSYAVTFAISCIADDENMDQLGYAERFGVATCYMTTEVDGFGQEHRPKMMDTECDLMWDEDETLIDEY